MLVEGENLGQDLMVRVWALEVWCTFLYRLNGGVDEISSVCYPGFSASEVLVRNQLENQLGFLPRVSQG